MTDRIVSSELMVLAEAHRREHRQSESDAWRRARMLYRGLQPEGANDGSASNASRSIAWNYVYQICDAAVCGLVGGSVQMQAHPEEEAAVSDTAAASRAMNEALRKSGINAEMRQAVLDAILLSRFVFEVRQGKDGPVVECVRPDTVYFDLEARQPKKIRYVLHAVPVHVDDVKRLIRERIYRRPDDMDACLQPSAMPEWLGRLDVSKPIPPTYVIVWRYYDLLNGKTTHWLDGSGIVLLEEDMPPQGCPLVIGSMISNGEDARGLSEIQLIARLQEILNGLVGKAWEVAAISEPVTIYDSKRVDPESVSRIFDAAGCPGRFVGVDTIGSDPNPLASHLFDLEQPAIPATHMQLLDLIPRIVSQVSALSDLQRGQTVGAKTATEIALLQSELKNRMASREEMLAEAMSEVAAKVWTLLSRRGKAMLVPTGDSYETVDPRKIKGSLRFAWHAYDAVKQNPFLEAEQVMSFLPIAQAYPQVVSPDVLVRHLYRIRGLPEEYLLPVLPPAPLAPALSSTLMVNSPEQVPEEILPPTAPPQMEAVVQALTQEPK